MRWVLLTSLNLLFLPLFSQNTVTGLSNVIMLDYTENTGVKSNTDTLIGYSNIILLGNEVQQEEETNKSNIPAFYALFIGINDYSYNSPELGDLLNPIKDASNLKNVLTDSYEFSEERIEFLKNPTRPQIISALEKLALKITEKDNLLIFYAGHGVWDSRLKLGYWLSSDSKIDDKSTWISNSTIRDYIGAIRSKHTLLIADACFGGSIYKTRTAVEKLNEWAISKIYQLPSRKAMTSGSLSVVPDESKFMEYLLKRLSDNTNKYLSTRQLFYSIETAILNNTENVPQLGVIQGSGDEGGDFIFIKKD